MKAKHVSIALALITALGLTGCMNKNVYNETQYENKAEERAVDHLQEKYGIKAKVVDSRCEYLTHDSVPTLYKEPSGFVDVTLEHGGSNILVRLNASDEESKAYDNYQQEEIRDAIENKWKGIISDCVCDSTFGYVIDINILDGRQMLVHDYFDGTNLTDIMQDDTYINSLYVYCSNQSIQNITYNDLLSQFGDNVSIHILNYKQGYDLEGKSHKYGEDETNIPFLIDSLYLDAYEHDIEYTKYEMKTCDMIEYVQSGTYANILESELDTDTEDMLGSKFNVLTAVSDIQVYSVNTDSEYLHTWFNVDEQEIVNENMKVYLAYQSSSSDSSSNSEKHMIAINDFYSIANGMLYHKFDLSNLSNVEIIVVK